MGDWLILLPLPTPDHPTPLPGLLPPDWREQQNPGLRLVAGGAGRPVVSAPQCVLSAPAGQVNEQVSGGQVFKSHLRGVVQNTSVSFGWSVTAGFALPPSDVCSNSSCQIHAMLPTTDNYH